MTLKEFNKIKKLSYKKCLEHFEQSNAVMPLHEFICIGDDTVHAHAFVKERGICVMDCGSSLEMFWLVVLQLLEYNTKQKMGKVKDLCKKIKLHYNDSPEQLKVLEAMGKEFLARLNWTSEPVQKKSLKDCIKEFMSILLPICTDIDGVHVLPVQGQLTLITGTDNSFEALLSNTLTQSLFEEMLAKPFEENMSTHDIQGMYKDFDTIKELVNHKAYKHLLCDFIKYSKED